MRNLLFVVIGCLSGCVLIVNHADDGTPLPAQIRVVNTTTQSVGGTDSSKPPAVHTSTVITKPVPLPPALIPPLPTRICALFVLPKRGVPPNPVDINDVSLRSVTDVEDALIEYSRSLERYIAAEQARLVAAHKAYLLKCNGPDIKNMSVQSNILPQP